MAGSVTLTGVERFFKDDEIIVSKTDLKGIITYGNHVFFRMAGYTERELIGVNHNIIRHPDMPRCVFKLLWDTLEAGREIFAYVVNRSKNGDQYWVFAHVTPSRDSSGNTVGYHSNRRVPDPGVVRNGIVPLYQALLAEEKKFGQPKEAMQASTALLLKVLKERNSTYEEFIFSTV